MWLLAGLGNPGEKYLRNRHNVGFMVIDAIADHFEFPSFRARFQGQIAEGKIGSHKVVLLKPQTYMNDSGQSIGKVAAFYKIPPSQIFIFHDELDLEPGKLRVKTGGGNAGHNGLKSAQAHLGTADFNRVRIGIGHPGQRDRVSPYVLSDFSKMEMTWVEPLCAEIAAQGEKLFAEKPDVFLSDIAVKLSKSSG
ncbi:MAG: aminoacyl-tRNA hydrolase [Alphaproteobacteria bacterium]|nr:aminoacyl-tRNA hydrolase [Alphaproteobacteria bacterium]